MEQADAQLREHRLLQALRHLRGGLQVARLRLLDERAHDVGLPPRRDLLAQELVDRPALGLAARATVTMGVRPGGSSSSTDTSRSP